jgi:hypothetical protein
MASIKALDKIASKWSTVTPQRAAEYSEGVQNPKADWAAETLKGSANYVKGIQAAIANKSFDKGVSKAGTDLWKKKTLEKGPLRWQQGVSISASDYQAGFSKYHAALSSLQLPPRGPKGDPGNINRVALVAKTLHDLKVKG